MIVCGLLSLGDFDLPWHLAVGRDLSNGHRLLSGDIFSYTYAGVRAPHDYLADAILYGFYRLGGTVGLQLLQGCAVAAIALLLLARARPAALLTRAGAAALGVTAAAPWFVLRPALFSFVCLTAELLLIDHHRRHRRTRSLRQLAWVVPLQLVWANLHGFSVIGALILLAYAGYVAACRLARGRAGALLPKREGSDAAPVALIAGAGFLATCLSSFGPRIFLGPLRVAGYASSITEWAPTTAKMVFTTDPTFALLVALILAALFAWRAAGVPALFDLGLILTSLVLALLRVRLIPLFVLIAAPLLARRVEALAHVARAGRTGALLLGLLSAPLVLLAPGHTHAGGFDRANLPERAVAFAKTLPLRGPLYNFLPFGGYLTFAMPEAPVFIDGRTAWLYPPTFVEQALASEHDPVSFAALAGRYAFQWALVRARPGERFSEPIASDPAWAMIYLDDCAALYVRRDGPNRALADAGYRALSHLTSPRELLAHPPPESLFDHDAALAVAQAPDSPRAHFIAALAAYARRDLPAVLDERDRLFTLEPSSQLVPALDQLLAAAVDRRSGPALPQAERSPPD